MKHLKYCSVLLFVFLLGGCGQAVEEVANKPEEVEASEPMAEGAEAKAADYFVIDVRSQEEWDDGHLENAVHIPHTEISERIAEVTADKNAKIFLH